MFVTNLEQKATILNDYFVQQCSEIATGSTLPTFQPRSRDLLEDVDIIREKVLNLIQLLDSKKVHGSNDISIAMIKICDASIVEPLCLICWQCLKQEFIHQYGKKLTLIPSTRKRVGKTKWIIDQFPCYQFLEQFLTNSYLIHSATIYVNN